MLRLIILFCCSLLSCLALSKEQVEYKDILALPYDEAHLWMQYGEDPLQKIGLWPGSHMVKDTDTAVVFIHGGCWLNAFDYHHAKGMYSALAQQGIDVYVISYRRTGDKGGGWPGTFDDIGQALTHLSTYWQHNTLPTTRILAGHSAGGHLALLAGQQASDNQPVFNTVIGLAAITNVTTYAMGSNSCQTATAKFFNATPAQNATAYANATPKLNKTATRFVTLHGDADKIVPLEHAYLPHATTLVIKGGGHFDWLHPDTPSFQQFLALLKEE